MNSDIELELSSLNTDAIHTTLSTYIFVMADTEAPPFVEELSGKLSDLGLPVPDELSTVSSQNELIVAKPVAQLLSALAGQLSTGHSALGLGSIAVPTTWSTQAVVDFARTLGGSYASSDSTVVAIDYLASELQAIRSALAKRRSSISAIASAPPAEGPVSLASELHLMGRLLSIPPFSDDSLRHAPEKPLASIHAKLSALLAKLPADALHEQVPLVGQDQASAEVLVRGCSAAVLCAHTVRLMPGSTPVTIAA